MSKIRTASAADIEGLSALRSAFSGELKGEPLAASPQEDDGSLAACGVGTVDQWLPGPHLNDGLIGQISNVYTAPSYRRRGYSRAILDGLLAWFNERGVARVELRASPSAEPMYRSVGFTDHPDPALSRYSPRDGLATSVEPL